MAVDVRTHRLYLLLDESHPEFLMPNVPQSTLAILSGKNNDAVFSQGLNFAHQSLILNDVAGRAYITGSPLHGEGGQGSTLHMFNTHTHKWGETFTISDPLVFDPYLTAIGSDPVAGHIFMPDASGKSVVMRDASTGRFLSSVPVGSEPQFIVALPHAHRVVVVTAEHPTSESLAYRVFILDSHSGKLVGKDRLAFLDNSIYVIDTTLDRIYYNGGSAGLLVQDGSTGRTLHIFPLAGNAGAMALSTRTRRIFIVQSDLNDVSRINDVSMIDARNGKTLRKSIHVGSNPSAIAIDDTAQRAFVVNQSSNTTSVLDARTGDPLGTIPVGTKPTGIAIDDARGRAFVYNESDKSVTVIDTRLKAY